MTVLTLSQFFFYTDWNFA